MKLVSISCAWVLGILLGSVFNFPLALLATSLIPLPLLFLYKTRKTLILLMAVCLFTFFGAAFYYPFSVPDDGSIAAFNNQGVVEIKGTIKTDPQVKNTITHLQISVSEIKKTSEWQDTQGTILVYVPRYPEYLYGDSLWLRGTLEDPPQFENFDYQAYLAREGIYSTLRFGQIEILERGTGFKPAEWLYSLRKRLSLSMAEALPEPQASLAQGIILGIRNTIPDDLKNNLSVTGTAHLLAISGMNLSIVAGVLVSLGLWLLGRRHYFYVWITLVAVWLYALITGMEAPVIRSAIMATMFLLAELLGRQKSAFVALAFGAAIMVGLNPQILWTASFQLSFLSMIGLIFISPTLQNLGRKTALVFLREEGTATNIVVMITDSISIALAAIIAVWPLIAYNFGLVSLVGPVATLLITPVFPAIIFCGTVTAALGIISPPLGQISGWITWLFLSYMLWLVNAFASLPIASIRSSSINISLVWTYYGILIILIYTIANFKELVRGILETINKVKPNLSRTLGVIPALPKRFLIMPLLLLALLVSLAAVSLPDKNLHVNFLDVGEGDSILIQNGGQNILIDGGPSPQAVCLGLGEKLPFWDRNLDLVVLTHPHLDHLNGLIEVLKRYKVKQIIASSQASDSPAYREWLNLIEQKNILYSTIRAGQCILLANGAGITVLSPYSDFSSNDDIDDNSLVLRLTKDKINFLFTADISQETESMLIQQRADISASVLKVAHHGSRTSTTKDFLTQVRPRVAVISVGTDNTFGHPDEQTLKRLTENLGSDIIVYRTDINGTVELITDGKSLRIKKAH